MTPILVLFFAALAGPPAPPPGAAAGAPLAAEEGAAPADPARAGSERKKTDERTPPPPPLPGPETAPRGPKPGEIPKPDIPLPEEEEFPFPLPIRIGESWLFFPLPIVLSDPNTGAGGGLMPIFLYNPAERIEAIIAPSVDYQELLGLSFTNRIFYYPTKQEELFVYNDVSFEGSTEHEISFHGRDRGFDSTDFVARMYYYVDGTRRFFGFGAAAEEDDETDYEQNEIGVEGDLGYRFWDKLRVAFTSRYRRTTVKRGIIDDLDDTVEVFEDIPGVDDEEIDALALGLRVTLDLRDALATPTEGIYIDLVGEAAPRGLVSEFGFWRWIIEARYLHRVYRDRWVHAMRATYHGIDADRRTPFWELPTLGGASNLRGFGVGRFTSDNYLLFSAEERFRLVELVLSRNNLIIEAAGFFDAGRVYGRGGGLENSDWSFVPGAGIRMLLPDSAIVARFDVGLGDEGPAVFIVLGYPF